MALGCRMDHLVLDQVLRIMGLADWASAEFLAAEVVELEGRRV